LKTIATTTLLIPEKPDPETDEMAGAWQRQGGKVVRLGKFWERAPALEGIPVCVYGGHTFALVLAQVYRLGLISPDERQVALLDLRWTKRSLSIHSAAELERMQYPCFIKPVVPKQFKAAVYGSHAGWLQEAGKLEDNEEVMTSTVMEVIQAEARGFVLNGRLLDMSIYAGEADVTEAQQFMLDFLASQGPDLPAAVVIDLGRTASEGWWVMEMNAAWGAGLNGCNADLVLPAILYATDQTPP
jgi:ATP-grasp domain, R2K clade family 2